jgi:hypothetical protein
MRSATGWLGDPPSPSPSRPGSILKLSFWAREARRHSPRGADCSAARRTRCR